MNRFGVPRFDVRTAVADAAQASAVPHTAAVRTYGPADCPVFLDRA
ncbi:hypothetical protein [Streptomyces sp. GESEQ-35]|nr:hypothetical protein [Streptomyces sp. GESEQ-35]